MPSIEAMSPASRTVEWWASIPGRSGSQAARGGDIDARATARPQPVQRRGLAVAQHGAGSAGEDGRQPVALAAELAVADRVDACVERHERPNRQAGLQH